MSIQEQPSQVSSGRTLAWAGLGLATVGVVAWFFLSAPAPRPQTAAGAQAPTPASTAPVPQPRQSASPVSPTPAPTGSAAAEAAPVPPPPLTPRVGPSAPPAPGPAAATQPPPSLPVPPTPPLLYVGPPPTSDPATWTLVPGDVLLGALRELDQAPATALSRDQLQAMLDLLGDVEQPGAALAQAALQLEQAAANVLVKPRQKAAIVAERASLAQRAPNLDQVIVALSKRAAEASLQNPSEVGAAPDLPANLVVAALPYLLDFQAEPLTPEQAARLLPSVAAYVAELKVQVAYYARMSRTVTREQLQAFVRILGEMRREPAALGDRAVSLEDTKAYFQQRLAR